MESRGMSQHVFHFFLPGADAGIAGTVLRVTDQDARRMERVRPDAGV